MSKGRFTKITLAIAAAVKPVLVKLVPIDMLRKAKRRMIASSMTQLDDKSIRPFRPDANPNGINLIGYVKGEIGLGQSCRLVASELEAAGVDFTIYNYEQVSSLRNEDASWDHKITNATPYNINLIHINPHELPLAFLQLNQEIWNDRYNIAFWLWELEDFPDEWVPCFKLVDEIWTPAEFVSESIRKKTTLPVATIPYALSAPTEDRFDRDYFHLPKDKFLFLFMGDSNSIMDRKNPMAAIDAFKQAFTPDNHEVGLVIKINNPQKKDIERIRLLLEGYENIYFITEILEKVQVNSLVKAVDVFVSLHRAEGFGLVLAEAMLVGTPVIATNWSANTEFMNEKTGCMVGYDFLEITEEIGPYKPGNRWADPHVEEAAQYMKKLYESPEYYASIASNAKESVAHVLGMEQAVSRLQKRLSAIYNDAEKAGK